MIRTILLVAFAAFFAVPSLAAETISVRDFTGFNRNHIVLGPKSKSTIVSATRFLGGLQITNQGHGKVETSANIDE